MILKKKNGNKKHSEVYQQKTNYFGESMNAHFHERKKAIITAIKNYVRKIGFPILFEGSHISTEKRLNIV